MQRIGRWQILTSGGTPRIAARAIRCGWADSWPPVDFAGVGGRGREKMDQRRMRRTQAMPGDRFGKAAVAHFVRIGEGDCSQVAESARGSGTMLIQRRSSTTRESANGSCTAEEERTLRAPENQRTPLALLARILEVPGAWQTHILVRNQKNIKWISKGP
jgi:hypothetical protein